MAPGSSPALPARYSPASPSASLRFVLAPFPRPPRNQRRGHSLARVTPTPDHLLQHVARPARLIAGVTRSLTTQAVQQPPQPRGSCDSRFTNVGSRPPSGSTAIITLSLWTSIPTDTLVLRLHRAGLLFRGDFLRRMRLWHLRSPQGLIHDNPAGAGPSICSR